MSRELLYRKLGRPLRAMLCLIQHALGDALHDSANHQRMGRVAGVSFRDFALQAPGVGLAPALQGGDRDLAA